MYLGSIDNAGYRLRKSHHFSHLLHGKRHDVSIGTDLLSLNQKWVVRGAGDGNSNGVRGLPDATRYKLHVGHFHQLSYPSSWLRRTNDRYCTVRDGPVCTVHLASEVLLLTRGVPRHKLQGRRGLYTKFAGGAVAHHRACDVLDQRYHLIVLCVGQ